MLFFKDIVLHLIVGSAIASVNPLTDIDTELVTRQQSKGDVYPVRQVIETPFEGPNNKSKWLGSIAVRPCGSILLTDSLAPNLYTVESPEASPAALKLVTSIPNANALTGITETEPDVYQVIAGDLSIKNESAVPGTLKLWSLDYSHSAAKPVVKKTADLDHSALINGLTYLGHNIVLGSDSVKGEIVAINTRTGESYTAWQDAYLTPKTKASNNSSTLGVNGIEVGREGQKTYLYFSVTAKSVLAKIEIDALTGKPVAGALPHVIVTTLGSQKGVGYDGFAIRMAGAEFFAADSRGNAIEQIVVTGGKAANVIVAGNINSTEVAEPSDAAFGRKECDRNVLYVCTAGGIFKGIGPQDKRVGGQLLAIDTEKH